MMTCKEIVKNLDAFIIGQAKAKRAVAIALRNRYRRSRLPKELKEEITPKNIILKGPTGVGKTEIARRLAKLVNAPFVKVEATKYTEVGYVGRDVESMIRDLVEASVRIVRQEQREKIKDKASIIVDKKITDILYPLKKSNKPEDIDTEKFREKFYEDYKKGIYDQDVIDIDVKEQPKQINLLDGGGGEINIGQKMGGLKSVLSMMPGISGKLKQIEDQIDEKKLERNKAIIQSMTPKERANPDIINGSRRQRIAKGAGVEVSDVNLLIKQFNQSKEMMKMMKNPKAYGGKMAMIRKLMGN